MDLTNAAFAGRILVGALFVVIGVRLVIGRRAVAMLLGSKKLPQPLAIAIAGGCVEIVLGLAALAGLALPAVFVAMALFVIAATAMVHDFWNKKGMARTLDVNVVLSHGLIVGGLIVMAAYPW
ncbi:DoxX family membrane protein [Mesorhizobium sp. BR1-1-16]|uniref:DoxX family membrane protein n=1 Tax=Mesorhizobium sp. BR1-1-16 TaxID=2876653 RepID=UPI001CCD5295|nr:DoxX family membrane protein [Mesorhizobium sp. BR1-1-16]MBZ9935542.1 DoxX family membrane protein [Mesorhizobium sp. BR1-1-16]